MRGLQRREDSAHALALFFLFQLIKGLRRCRCESQLGRDRLVTGAASFFLQLVERQSKSRPVEPSFEITGHERWSLVKAPEGLRRNLLSPTKVAGQAVQQTCQSRVKGLKQLIEVGGRVARQCCSGETVRNASHINLTTLNGQR